MKLLSELLSNNIKTSCFVISDTGITLRMMDNNRRLLIDLDLLSDGFSHYTLNSAPMHIGINSGHFFRILKSVRKKDLLELFIDSETSSELCIKVTPKENNRTTVSSVKIQNIQNLNIALPESTTKPILVPSTELQKMLKDFGSIGSSLEISSNGSKIKYSCNAGDILKRAVEFGEVFADEGAQAHSYAQEFNTEQLCRISKLSGLSNTIRIYCDKPMRYSTNTGTIGKISIYVKSKEELESELCNEDDDGSEA